MQKALTIMAGRGRRAAALTGLCLIGLAPAIPAQEAQGGLSLTFGLGLRLETDDNAGLDPVSQGETSRAVTALSFGLTSETRTASLALAASADLRASSGPEDTADGLVNPALTLAYALLGANATYTLDAALRETDLATDDDVTDFDGTAGTRRSATLDTGLQWGTGGPLGFGVTAGLTDLSYSDAPGEADSRTERLGLTAQLALSSVSTLDLGLRASRFEDDADARRDTLGFDAGIDVARPSGEMGLRLAVDDTEDGLRSSLSLDRSYATATTALSYSIGVARGANDDVGLIGSLDYSRALPQGSLSIGLDRSVGNDSDDEETVVTSASLGYRQDLGPLSRVSMSLNWAESKDTGTDLVTANTSLGATYSRDLTEDWALDLGYLHRIRDEAGVGRGDSNLVFLGLRREFTALK